MKKRRFLPFCCRILCLVLAVILFSVSSFAVTDGATDDTTDGMTDLSTDQGGNPPSTDTETKSDLIHGAYTFDDPADLTADVGSVYPLSTKEFGDSLIQAVSGRRNGGLKGFFHLNPALFHNLTQFSMGFWINLSLDGAKNMDTVFQVSGTNGENLSLQFAAVGDGVQLKLNAADGKRSAVCTYDLSEVLTEEEQWVHIAYTYKKSGTVSLITLYVNGKSTSISAAAKYVDFSQMTCLLGAFHDITVDDLYLTQKLLESQKIVSLMNQSADAFYRSENSLGGSGGSSDEGTDPTVGKHGYTWAAYLFDGTFAAGTDYHSGDIPATANNGCVLIDSSKLKQKYGYAMIRRDGSAPAEYLSLDSRLFYRQSSFTFSAWVYRNGTETSNGENLLELEGKGILRFSPYADGGEGSYGYVEYTDARGNLRRDLITGNKIPSSKNNWVHYALTVSDAGDLTVYVNAVPVAKFSTGVSPAKVEYSKCKVVTGVSATDPSRTAIDEVYVTPKVLSEAEIRKIQFYGLARYTSEVLPDPGSNQQDEETPVNPYAPDGVDIAEDAYQKTGSISNGFIGTTFDARENMGKDWNSSAPATITNGRLAQGISSYGLAMDGSSFVRYPAGILDGVSALTLSLSYSWSGAEASASRSQRIFDFSRKTSSVADPSASIFLETGDGISGLRFGITDGTSSTYLTCDYNAVDTWTRVTVTVADGKITLYLNDTVAATGYTDVDLASICPNFCYLGRSGVKGDPMFVGTVDEVYISSKALTAEEVVPFMQGLSYAINGDVARETDLWGVILISIIVVGILLILAVVAVIVVIIVKKDRNTSEQEAPIPVPFTDGEAPQTTIIGPRSALRHAAPPSQREDATVKFQKVDESSSLKTNGEATTKFRRITDDEND